MTGGAPVHRFTDSSDLQEGNRGLRVRADELRRRRSGLAMQSMTVRGMGETARVRPRPGLTLRRREDGTEKDYVVRAGNLASGLTVRTVHTIQNEHLADAARVECLGKHWAPSERLMQDRSAPHSMPPRSDMPAAPSALSAGSGPQTSAALSVGATKRNGLNGALQDRKGASDPWSMRWVLPQRLVAREPPDVSGGAEDKAPDSTALLGQRCNHVEQDPGLDDEPSLDIEVMFKKAHARLRANEKDRTGFASKGRPRDTTKLVSLI